MTDRLTEFLAGNVAVLGFGNRLWRDDGAGSVLAERLKDAHPHAPVFDAGMVPENFLEKVAATEPDRVLLIDAADFAGEPGEVRMFAGDDLAFTGISTHAGSPRMLAGYLEARTGAQVALLAIQTGNTEQGDGLSAEVETAVTVLAADLGQRCFEN